MEDVEIETSNRSVNRSLHIAISDLATSQNRSLNQVITILVIDLGMVFEFHLINGRQLV